MVDNVVVILTLGLGLLALLFGGWFVSTRRGVVAGLITVFLGVVIALFSFGYATDLSDGANTNEPRDTQVVVIITP